MTGENVSELEGAIDLLFLGVAGAASPSMTAEILSVFTLRHSYETS